jgi:hypothetical protein
MSCNKLLMAATRAAGFAVAIGAMLTAHASSTPSFDGAIAADAPPSATPALTRAASVATISTASGSSTARLPTAASATTAGVASQPVALSVSMPDAGGDSHLTLREIDKLARDKVARALRDGDEPASSPAASHPATPVNPVDAKPPAEAPIPTFISRTPRVDPVTFVGSFRDDQGMHVLYEYDGAVYPARLGEKLLNGWVVRKIDGLTVTVAQGKRTWSSPMRGGAPDDVTTTSTAPAAVSGPLRDLGSPLPSWMISGNAGVDQTQLGR